MKKLGKKLHSCQRTIEAYSSCGDCTMSHPACGYMTTVMVNYWQNDRNYHESARI